jgi:hypothetical protein
MEHMHLTLQCLRGSILGYRAHKRAVQVLKISLAWGERFAADAQLKCPLHTPLPLPSYDLNTSECFVYIPEFRFQVLSAFGHCHVSSRNIFLGPFQGAPCWQILQCRKHDTRQLCSMSLRAGFVPAQAPQCAASSYGIRRSP